MFDDSDDLVPISRLFYDDDGPHIVAGEEYLIPISQFFFDDDGPHVVATQPAPARYTPARGLELQNLIGTTIAQLGAVSGGTRKTPTPLPARRCRAPATRQVLSFLFATWVAPVGTCADLASSR